MGVVHERFRRAATRGYGYFQLDAFGAGERLPLGGHDDGGVHLAITGASMGGILAWDNMRALDYLCSRPEVDASKIGVTGASGGGNQSMYIAALDERITAASGKSNVENLVAQIVLAPGGVAVNPQDSRHRE